jgi:hypothetical protein
VDCERIARVEVADYGWLVASGKRLTDWRRLLGEHTPIARQMVLKLVDGRIVFTPKPEDGCYEVSGRTLSDEANGCCPSKREAGKAAALLQLCDSRQRLGSQHRRVTGDVEFPCALRARYAPVKGRYDLAQVFNRPLSCRI